MVDVHNKTTRSKNMRAIKGTNTKPELEVRKALHAKGFRFRLHRKDLPGNPDITLPRYKVLIFVHGCFWHGHRCHLSKTPSTRTDFWLSKISDNMSRDLRTETLLLASEWRYAVIWECALKSKSRLPMAKLIGTLEDWIINTSSKSLEVVGLS